ncbi:ATP-binding protein [Enterocloster lavalensis]|uniref:ATP-binding protein n=1 Tax=Enterocloster lavalensis TaxID=460384 RepID=UPI002665EBBD|nr:PAS domain-containing hybrid sensor histidine kinase/response regulator [Enterocloster lavalensis]
MFQKPYHESSSEPLAAILDSAPASIIVCSAQSHVLLYANERACKQFLKEDYRPGITCYEAAGCRKPCSFCRYEEQNSAEFTVRNYREPVTQRIYQISSKMIDWEGTPAHIEYIVDVTGARTELEETQMKMDHLVNSIPGGIVSYEIQGKKTVPVFISEGLLALSGHTRNEYNELVNGDTANIIYEADRARVLSAAYSAVESGQAMDVSCRLRHKDGHLVWIHINGRRIGPKTDTMRFYAVFTGMSEEAILFRSIANETEDRVYVIDKESYELFYASESSGSLCQSANWIGQKCYSALYGKNQPCEFCTLKSHEPDGLYHSMDYHENGRFYSTRFRETLWNGIPAYLKYVRDVTEEVKAQKEKEHMEQYFQTLVKKLPGGVAVVRIEKDGRRVPEYLSDGYAVLCGMSMDELWKLYGEDGMAAVHPDDVEQLNSELADFVASGEEQREFTYRIKSGNGDYIWIKNTASMLQRGEGEVILYASYRDLTMELKEQEQIRRQYKELILQHYQAPDPNTLIVGHCNITKSQIMEISDYTDSDLLECFGTEREAFFTGISTLIQDEKERRDYLNRFLNEPTRIAFQAGKRELEQDCFIRLPKDVSGRYVKFKVNLVEEPDTGDITGILTVYDITEQIIADRNLQKLSTSGYDLIADVDLIHDTCTILSGGLETDDTSAKSGRHSDRMAYMRERQLVPKDRPRIMKMLEPAYMLERLKREDPYSFSYSILGKAGEIQTKKLTVSATDLRLGRVCLARADITDSVREQQGLLNVVAYTFEMLGIIYLGSRNITLYTHQAVLQVLEPQETSIESWLENIRKRYIPDGGEEEIESCFGLQNMLSRLEERPGGYDFVLPCLEENERRYKQINILWGDRDHKMICIVRQDVTETMTAERRSKEALERALALAEEASRAKSDFLSSMSHDIRTPMNAIMGMTTLARAHLDEREKVESCLQKISLSSRHLLSLINDILDMSKIEQSKITLNHDKVCLSELVEQLSSMMGPQAQEAGVKFDVRISSMRHLYFYGDALRINQILINILGNAIKFTPEGGTVTFLTEELPSEKGREYVRYCFTIRDTGIGMPESFLSHLFEPFTRNRSTQRVEGSGLGLSITKGLVDLMGGSLSVESRERTGTTFHVELEYEIALDDSAADSAEDTAPSTALGEGRLNGRCLLVAEDNEINAEILSELLLLQGVRTVVKTDGVQVLHEYQRVAYGTYDAVLMDIQMPEMNGYEAARAIRDLEQETGSHIPIIAMTANAFAEDIQEAMRAGMDAHVAKPIDMQILMNTLDKLIV